MQISYVLNGKLEATIESERKIISKGDTYITEPNIPHGVRCLEKGALLAIFTPIREDFLKQFFEIHFILLNILDKKIRLSNKKRG